MGRPASTVQHLAQRIELWPLDRLTPYARNPRTHTDEDVQRVAASILEYGFTNPILVGDGQILAGHKRFMAAQLLGLDVVPVIDLSYLSPAQRRAYVIADNRLAEDAGWDDQLLTEELRALQADGFDLALTGFHDDELAQFLDATEQAGQREPTEWHVQRTPVDPITRPGDVWTCGQHRVVCGSATDPAVWRSLTNIGPRAVTFTSPPYGIAPAARLRDHYVPGRETPQSIYAQHNDSPKDWPHLMRDWSTLALEHTGVVLCNVQMLADNKRSLLRWSAELAEHLIDVVIWDKGNGPPPQMQPNVLNNAFEFVFILAAEPGASRSIPFASFHGDRSNVVRIGTQQERSDLAEVHRAVMPVALAEWAINLCSETAEFVDPFGGTGTTMIAAEHLKRRAQIIEIDPGYVDVSVKRYQELTGQQAVLEQTGEPFDQREREHRAKVQHG